MGTYEELARELAGVSHELDECEFIYINSLDEEAREKYIEFIQHKKDLQEQCELLRGEIKSLILYLCTDQNAYGINAKYVRGRQMWDSKKLEKLLDKYPELSECKVVASPSVRIS